MEREKFFFRDGPYLQTLKGLYKALSQPEAFVTLIGNANTGKSSLCRLLNDYLKRKDFRTVYFHNAIESPEMLRTMLARELDIPESANFARLVEDALLHGDGKPVVLIFDNAHLFTDVTLLEIYRLAEIQANNKRMPSILLCGEPALEQHLLSRQEFKTLLLNVSQKFVLEPMDVETLPQFINAYLEKAGLPDVEIEPAAMTYFWKCSKGFPGPTASICKIIAEAKAGQAELTPLSKQELVQLLQGSGEVQSATGIRLADSNQWFLLGPVAAVVVIASIGLIYQQLRPESGPDLEAAAVAPIRNEPSPFSQIPAPEQTEAAAVEPIVEVVLPPVAVAPTPSPDEVIAEPVVATEVSDSGLALVTATERGIDQSQLVAPEFEDLIGIANQEAEPTVLRIEDEEELSFQAAPVAELEPDILEIPEVTEPEQPVVVETPPVIEPGLSAEAPLDEADVAEPAAPDLERVLLASIESWVDAWQEQRLDDYFASYHPAFQPRYQDTVALWQANRERVIGNAEWIRLQLTDFEIIAELEDQVEVNFWLAYESPTYSDNTLKKLVLGTDGGGWLILEEVNLQVRR